MSQGNLIGPEPRLAEDGKCINIECSKRDSDECPVFRLRELFTLPQVTNILNFPEFDRDKVGFQKETYLRYLPKNVTSFEESKEWLRLESDVIKGEEFSIHENLIKILGQKSNKRPTAEIIQFPQEKRV